MEDIRYLAERCRDILLYRIELVLEEMAKVQLYDLPTDEPVTTDEFLRMIEACCQTGAQTLAKYARPWLYIYIYIYIYIYVGLLNFGSQGLDYTYTIHGFIHTYTRAHTRLTALFPRIPGLAGTRKVKPIWILLKQSYL